MDKQRNIKIKSYIVIIYYKSVHFSLGPYEDYDICLTIKEVIITQLKKKNFYLELNIGAVLIYFPPFSIILSTITIFSHSSFKCYIIIFWNNFLSFIIMFIFKYNTSFKVFCLTLYFIIFSPLSFCFCKSFHNFSWLIFRKSQITIMDELFLFVSYKIASFILHIFNKI